MAGSDQPAAVTLHSSRIGWLLIALGFSAVAAVAVAAFVERPAPASAVVFVVITAIFAVVLRTQPWDTVIGESGVTRRCPLHRDEIPWEMIDAFERLRRSKGLVVRIATGQRRMVCDRMEGRAEHDRLRAVVEAYQSAVAVPEPPDLDQRPTDLYRRNR